MNMQESAPREGPTIGLRCQHILSLILFFCFLMTGVDGNFQLRGDDIHETSLESLNHAKKANLLTRYRARNGLRYSYFGYRHYVASGSFATANLITWYVFGASAILFYFVLSSYFTPTVAWLGSLLYLVHSSKFEALTWFAASAYVPTVIMIILTIWVSRFNRSPILQGLSIGILGWLSMLWYEIFVVMFPVYMIMMIGGEYVKHKRVSLRVIAGSLIPLCVIVVHILILSGADKPIWNRSMVNHDYRESSLVYKVCCGFVNTLDTTIGIDHIDFLDDNIVPFASHYIFQQMWLLIALTAAVTYSAFLLYRQSKVTESAPAPVATQFLIGFSGLYIMLFAGVPSFVISLTTTPSRLTFLTTIGICIFVCALLELARSAHHWSNGKVDLERSQKWLKRGSAFVMICIVLEAMAFSSIIHQEMDAFQYDQRLSNRIHDIYPSVNGNETFFLDLPESEKSRAGIWGEAGSSFERNNPPAWLWYIYDQRVNSLDFDRALRRGDQDSGAELTPFIAKWQGKQPEDVVPFYVSDQGEMYGIRQVELLDGNDQSVETIRFASHANTRQENLVNIRLIKNGESFRMAESMDWRTTNRE